MKTGVGWDKKKSAATCIFGQHRPTTQSVDAYTAAAHLVASISHDFDFSQHHGGVFPGGCLSITPGLLIRFADSVDTSPAHPIIG